jgi:hypothetical protein
MGLSACGSAANTPTTTTTSAASLQTKAENAYLAVFNQMIGRTNALVAQDNSQDPATATAGWKATVSDQKAFDRRVQQIKFPPPLQLDADSVVSADIELETIEGTLAINTDSVSNYNSIFDTLTPAQAAFNAANATLTHKLGLSPNS